MWALINTKGTVKEPAVPAVGSFKTSRLVLINKWFLLKLDKETCLKECLMELGLSRTQAGHGYPAGRCKVKFTTHSLLSPFNLLNQEAAREEGAHQSMLRSSVSLKMSMVGRKQIKGHAEDI